MNVNPRYTFQESQMFLDFSIKPVVKIKLSDKQTGISSIGYGDDAELAKEHAFSNLKINEEKYLGKYFANYDLRGKVTKKNIPSYRVNERI